MQKLVIKSLVALSLGIAGAHFGITAASAGQPAGKGKTDIIPNLDLPYGVEKKYTLNPNTGYQSDKKVPEKFASQVRDWNTRNGYPRTTIVKTPEEFAESEAAIVVCPSTLDDEQMRLCLGLPPVKKAVRVKRLNVQIGQAE